MKLLVFALHIIACLITLCIWYPLQTEIGIAPNRTGIQKVNKFKVKSYKADEGNKKVRKFKNMTFNDFTGSEEDYYEGFFHCTKWNQKLITDLALDWENNQTLIFGSMRTNNFTLNHTYDGVEELLVNADCIKCNTRIGTFNLSEVECHKMEFKVPQSNMYFKLYPQLIWSEDS